MKSHPMGGFFYTDNFGQKKALQNEGLLNKCNLSFTIAYRVIVRRLSLGQHPPDDQQLLHL